MIDIEIDGKKLQVDPGTMIIKAADDAGIWIPRFCYHKKLSIAANCRMCLVHVEKSAKPLPACATPVSPNMVIHTKTKEAIEAQKSVMEFLLINHPLDCPICDQGGQCELQDIAMGFGNDGSRYFEGKRSVEDKDIGSLISTDMTRCIQCTRCVRFGEEIAGFPEIGGTGRGEHLEIGTYISKSLTSEVSGNIIDLCPVGALTSKPFRFKARAWELNQSASIAPHDCVGSNIFLHQLRQKIMRVVPRENEAVNESWLSDRDRYSYEGLYADDRMTVPMVKRYGKWEEVDWKTALEAAVEGLQKVVNTYGAQQLGILSSPNATLEEFYLLQKLGRELGTHNIDHRLRQSDFADQNYLSAYPNIPCSLADIEKQKSILLLGSNIQREQPVLSLRIRKAALAGATIIAINPIAYDFHFEHRGHIVAPNEMVQMLASVAKALLLINKENALPAMQDLLRDVKVNETQQQLAQHLIANPTLILMGALSLQHPQASTLRSLVQTICSLTQAQFGILSEGANAAGAWLAGAIPHRSTAGIAVTKPGLDAKKQLAQPLKGYILFNMEPEFDCANPALAERTLLQSEFVVAMTPYLGNAMSYANVILPIVPFSETSGTFVNVEGRWQSFTGAVKAIEEARPGWKILRVLGNLLGHPGFEYTSSQEIHDELKQFIDGMTSVNGNGKYVPSQLNFEPSKDLQRITEWSIYRVDNIVRRSVPLQESGAADMAALHIHPQLAEQMHFQAGDAIQIKQDGKKVTLPLVCDERIPMGCVYVPGGFVEVAALGECFGAVTLERS